MYKIPPSYYLKRMANASSVQEWQKYYFGMIKWVITHQYFIMKKYQEAWTQLLNNALSYRRQFYETTE